MITEKSKNVYALAPRTLVTPHTKPKPAPMPRLRYVCAAGIAGFGLCVGGFLFGATDPGIVGVVVIFIMAISWVWSGGMDTQARAQHRAPAPVEQRTPAPESAVAFWSQLTAEQKARTWTCLTDGEKIRLVNEVFREKVTHA